MSDAQEPTIHSMNAQQEAHWFQVSKYILITFFCLVGGILSWMLWSAKVEERRQQAQIMDAAAQDPGVTTAQAESTTDSIPVEVGIYVERITALSIKETSWQAAFDIWFRWAGDLPHPGEDFVLMDGSVDSKVKLAETEFNGVHYVRYGVTATFSKSFSITRFPLDEHLLTIAVESGSTIRGKLLFVPDMESANVSSRTAVAGYQLTVKGGIEKPHSYKTTRGDPRLPPGTKSTFSQYRYGLMLSRAGWGLYFKMFQALFVAVVVAMLACFIKPTDVDPRFGLGVGGLFAAVANSYLVSSFVPDTGSFALADVVNVIGIMTILVTIIVSTVSLHLYDRRGEVELSGRLDRMAFTVIASCFLGVNLVMLICASA
jgi:hypothetical protein